MTPLGANERIASMNRAPSEQVVPRRPAVNPSASRRYVDTETCRRVRQIDRLFAQASQVYDATVAPLGGDLVPVIKLTPTACPASLIP
jgi:hypothetical protein